MIRHSHTAESSFAAGFFMSKITSQIFRKLSNLHATSLWLDLTLSHRRLFWRLACLCQKSRDFHRQLMLFLFNELNRNFSQTLRDVFFVMFFFVKIHSVAEDLIFYRITDITRKHEQFRFFLMHWDEGLGKSSTVIITPPYLPNSPVSTPSHNACVHQTFLVKVVFSRASSSVFIFYFSKKNSFLSDTVVSHEYFDE